MQEYDFASVPCIWTAPIPDTTESVRAWLPRLTTEWPQQTYKRADLIRDQRIFLVLI